MNYVEYYVGHEGLHPVRVFPAQGRGEENVDGYLDHYFAVKKKTDRNEFEDTGRSWTTWRRLVSGILMRGERLHVSCLRRRIRPARASPADELEENCGGSMRNDPYIWSYIGRVRYREGKG